MPKKNPPSGKPGLARRPGKQPPTKNHLGIVATVALVFSVTVAGLWALLNCDFLVSQMFSKFVIFISARPSSLTGWQTFRYIFPTASSSGKAEGFEFRYPPDYAAQQPEIAFLDPSALIKSARVDMPTGKFPGTNLVEAGITVNAYSAATMPSTDCLVKINGDVKLLNQIQDINGATFYKGETTGLAAGNIYDSVIYRALRNQICYELVETIHTGNIYNYPAGTVAEVDKSRIWPELNRIVGTFRFLGTTTAVGE